MKLVRVVSGKFEAAFETNGRVIRTSRILRFLLEKPDAQVRAIIQRNKWKAAIVEPACYPDLVADLTERTIYTPEEVEWRDSISRDASVHHVHTCHCGELGLFGFGVRLLYGREGEWLRGKHWRERAA